jgi:mercuric ion binding protein
MKTKFTYITGLLILLSSALYGQPKTIKTSIKVSGNCVMCKNRIETALDHAGVRFASWSAETKMLEVAYNNRKISEKEIHELVAAAGHDTDAVKAEDEVYGKLPFCCLYRDHDHSNIRDEPHNH